MKKRVLTSYSKLSDTQKEMIKKQYPNGIWNSLITIPSPGDTEVKGFTLDDSETSYLVRMDNILDEDEVLKELEGEPPQDILEELWG